MVIKAGMLPSIFVSRSENEFTCPSLVEGDLDQDGLVGASDLAVLLLDFGGCIGCYADLDLNDAVDGGDIALLLLMMN